MEKVIILTAALLDLNVSRWPFLHNIDICNCRHFVTVFKTCDTQKYEISRKDTLNHISSVNLN